MNLVLDYFTNEAIYKSIVNIRIAQLKKRNKLHADREISHHHKTNFHNKEKYKGNSYLKCIVPPRRSWVKPSNYYRKNVTTNSQARVRFSLMKTYEKVKERANADITSSPMWYVEFLYFCNYIRYKVSVIEREGLNEPDLFAIPKKKKTNTAELLEYRPIMQYCLEDRVIIGLTAKYFVDVLDSEFLDVSFAFRKTTKGKAITHHDAFAEIIKFKEAKSNNNIYVAECDIQKFFDCVNHDVARECLKKIEDRLNARGVKLDVNALNVFESYLRSFSFNRVILPKNNESWFLSRKLQPGRFKWVQESLSKTFGYDFEKKSIDIGIPQGGALSCVISNIILDSVDRKTLNSESDSDLIYARYCDDMILMHLNAAKCLEALNRYREAVLSCKLLIHSTAEDFFTKCYNKDFWESKSKPIYCWGNKSKLAKNNVPWIGFVGYQMRYDCKLRVRKDSFNKQKQKLKDEYERILSALNHSRALGINPEHFRVNNMSVVSSFKTRVISMSVGRPNLRTPYKSNFDLCWAKGFQLIKNNSIYESQLRELDRRRTFQYYKLNKILPDVRKKALDREDNKLRPYFGTPFSYYSIIFPHPLRIVR
ncbi:reverse transcriptase domain-containing protein [Chitinophagaceae bacterium MMS25-I14]